MPYDRGDIIEVNLAMPPDGKVLNHPAVIISNNEVYDDDDCYIIIMLTSQEYEDKYTYRISDEMLLQKSNMPYIEARCHLLTYILKSHIVANKNRNKLKRHFVDALVEHMVNSVLY